MRVRRSVDEEVKASIWSSNEIKECIGSKRIVDRSIDADDDDDDAPALAKGAGFAADRSPPITVSSSLLLPPSPASPFPRL